MATRAARLAWRGPAFARLRLAARRLRRLAAALFAAAGTACLQDDGSRFNPISDALSVSDDDERELGLQFDQQLREMVVVVEDPLIAGFIHDLGQEIVRTLEPQPFIYRFRIVQDPSLNAFAVPGGYIYFHSGTILAAGSIDELAGVMGHEIAHVKAHHYARMREKTQIPDLLVGVAGMAAAVASGEPGVAIAAQAANVAVQLKFSREFETEADQLGSIFMTRAGWQPDAITRFFERIVAEHKRYPDQIPPYLFSHPDVEDRIATVRAQAETLEPTRVADPQLAAQLPEVQARLAWLLDNRRTSAPPPDPPEDPRRLDPLLEQTERLAQEGQIDEALFTLARAEAIEPRDPRAPYRIGELLAARGRHREAAQAYRRAIRLDPTRALVFYKLGLSHRHLYDRHVAVYAFEQASRRAGATSPLRERADWQIETLIFPVLLEAGFSDGDESSGETPFGQPTRVFPAGASRVVFWGRLSPRYPDYPEHLRVRFTDPHGRPVGESDLEEQRGGWLSSPLDLPADAAPGEWAAEVWYRTDLLERHTFRLQD
jgi:predicted Zn-dependent protease